MDHLGNTKVITNASGIPVEYLDYEAFGNPKEPAVYTSDDGSFERCSLKRLYGDPDKTNSQNYLYLGAKWRAAMHHCPADEYCEIAASPTAADGAKVGRIYDNGSGKWKALVLSNSILLTPNKWYRISVKARAVTNLGTKYASAYLSYNAADNEGDQQVTKRVSWSASELAGGEWVRKYVIFRVPSTPNGAPYWEVYAYLYGHYGEGVIEFDDYRIEEFVTQPSGPPPETPGYEYTGKKRDSATGLYYFGARYYDPEVGRFITEDPKNSSFKIYSPQTYNRYVYCLNNPLGYIDPDGKETVVVIFREKMLGFLWVATHTAMRVDNPLGEPVMYDPAGKSYHPVDQYGGPIRGSGDQFEGKYADLQALLDIYEAEGYKCDVYSFKTTPEEEKTIADRIEEKGGVSPLLCATAISDVLRGVGPFEKLKGSIFPGRLGKGLSKIKQSTIEIKEEVAFYGVRAFIFIRRCRSTRSVTCLPPRNN